MSYQITGMNFIAGEWVASEETFTSTPHTGEGGIFSMGSAELVDQAVVAAENCFAEFSSSTRSQRADFLRAIAEEIDLRGDQITEIAMAETALPEARLIGERGRTTMQLRLFADHIDKGDYLDVRKDQALPDRQPLPRPDLRMMQLPIGPVAVFGASNFPLAFSVAGGDTASALAAGCPVIVKGHEAHPGTSEIVAQAIEAAAKRAGMPPGVFSLVQGGSFVVGQSLVQHPLINAVGFTGSLGAGRALFDLCSQRTNPIPFFGELGSINPMFMLPSQMSNKAEALGDAWAASLTMGVGQFCTNPGLAVVLKGSDGDRFVDAANSALQSVGPQTMLTENIAKAYRTGQRRISSEKGVREVLTTTCDLSTATPYLYEVDVNDWLDNAALCEEVFGPLGLIVRVESREQMLEVAHALDGQLTCTLHMDEQDTSLASELLPVLARKAGRVLANGFPTGVEVCDSMVHGGPYPASTNFGATSVGTLAIRRFLRPVCYQNIPADLLPSELK
ncbi:MAG: aldehyde dehydrogenase (NADP(+)) [Alphaproteobacteria bacterium]